MNLYKLGGIKKADESEPTNQMERTLVPSAEWQTLWLCSADPVGPGHRHHPWVHAFRCTWLLWWGDSVVAVARKNFPRAYSLCLSPVKCWSSCYL